MSREIRFRIYDKKRKSYIGDENGFTLQSLVLAPCDETVDKIEDYVFEQDTGLKDKNGKMIREGDIVEFGLAGRGERGYVAYADEYASFEVYSKRDFIFGCLFGHAGTVIGNIHENPELLGGEE